MGALQIDIVVDTICFKFSVIANQAAAWCGNPLVERNQETITTKNRDESNYFGKLSVQSPSNRGIATPACALARNDSISLQTTIYSSNSAKLGEVSSSSTAFWAKVKRSLPRSSRTFTLGFW